MKYSVKPKQWCRVSRSCPLFPLMYVRLACVLRTMLAIRLTSSAIARIIALVAEHRSRLARMVLQYRLCRTFIELLHFGNQCHRSLPTPSLRLARRRSSPQASLASSFLLNVAHRVMLASFLPSGAYCALPVVTSTALIEPVQPLLLNVAHRVMLASYLSTLAYLAVLAPVRVT